eukprot:COSAG06_NODE_853_length_11950_cov_3.644249_2_plen_132_part_00
MADFLDTGLISIELMAGRPGVAGRPVLTECQRDDTLVLATTPSPATRLRRAVPPTSTRWRPTGRRMWKFARPGLLLLMPVTETLMEDGADSRGLVANQIDFFLCFLCGAQRPQLGLLGPNSQRAASCWAPR